MVTLGVSKDTQSDNQRVALAVYQCLKGHNRLAEPAAMGDFH